MIAGPGAPTSVSPNAPLFSAGWVQPLIINDPQLLTTQYIAKKYAFTDPRHIRVINHSWLDGGVSPFNGNERLTLGMDWMASKFDILNVVSGPYGDSIDVSPADNFNGVTVAFTSKDDGFRRVAAPNHNDNNWDAEGGRVSVDLLAPGEGISIANAGGGVETGLYGTSYAAPHVTGAVALLGEYSDYQTFIAEEPRWDWDNPRRHEVLKAILLNSANKLVTDEGGNDWDNSVAYWDDTISLDQEMGAGLLDVGRALAQFAPGEYNVGELIPPIGWDWGETGGFGSVPYEYPFADELPVGKITITLAWDRRVTKTSGLDNTFAPSDGFTGHDVDNLDLFLLPAGATDPVADSIPLLRSWSEEDNVEHIYADIPEKADYKIVVYQRSGDEVDYGLAWWTGNPADFDKNGVVDGSDLSEWKSDFGAFGGSDADFDTDTDGNDFLAWQRNLGVGIPAVPASTPVPESRSSILCASCLAILLVKRDRMNRTAVLLLAGLSLVGARPVHAANLELARISRPATSQEVAGGVPANGVVHNFYVTSDADLLSVETTMGLPLYNHRLGDNQSAPSPELVAEFPALGADSFLRMPSSTLVLGGGFNGKPSVWGDLENDGPQTNFLFGRLTTTEPGTFTGNFAVRGEVNPITLPFTFSLPGPGESLLAATSERHFVTAEEWRPPEPAPPAGPNLDQSTPLDYRGPVNVEIERRSRPISAHEWISKKGGGYVHEFFVTTSTDLISVGDVEVEGKVYQHREGSDRKPPNDRVLRFWPDSSADSFITTPGRTEVLGKGFYGAGDPEIVWYDETDDGPLDEFLFARLTTDETGSFSGEINVRGPGGAVSLPFEFLLPGNERDLALLAGEPTYRLHLSFDEAAATIYEPAAAVPEPAAAVLALTALALLRRK